MITFESIKRSSLWAAYGDALGFITELANEFSVTRRTKGKSKVTALMPWTRRIGGKFGINIELPKGCYSDDTQLRLATSRSIRGDGTFDVETFSKIELPVWLSYALGAGTGTKSAVMSLGKRQIQWNTNFFTSEYSRYTNSGGNGACMRIQPHIWSSNKNKANSEILRDIVRNTVTTHGHCRALVGAAFHALVLRKTMLDSCIPNPMDWLEVLSEIQILPQIIHSDEQLRMYWIGAWESESHKNLEEGIFETIRELKNDISLIVHHLDSGNDNQSSEYSYKEILHRLGCLDKSERGSGTKTSLMASFASYLFQNNISDGLTIVANSLGSDTDTIATMAGAIMGVIAKNDPPEEVMDQTYLNEESKRLYYISQREKVKSFVYPDLLYWQPPTSSIKVVGKSGNKWVIQGFGDAIPIGSEHIQKNKYPIIWQWFQLNFGQTILLKRNDFISQIPEKLLPANYFDHERSNESDINNLEPPSKEKEEETKRGIRSLSQGTLWDNAQYKEDINAENITAEYAADLVIKKRFNTKEIGSLLLKLAEQENGEEQSMLFAKLIAKARIARIKH